MALGPHAESEAEVLEPHEIKGIVGGRIHVAVVTPRGKLLDREVDEIIAPGVEGELGVLPGHVAFLTALKSGAMVIREGNQRSFYAVGPGFLEVGAGGMARILVGEAVLAEDIDIDAARAEAGELGEQLKQDGGRSADANAVLAAKLAWARARVATHTAHAAAQKM